MTEKEKFDYLIEQGFTATECGKVISHTGKSIGYKKADGYLRFSSIIDSKTYTFYKHRFIYYYFYNIVPLIIDHINGVRSDNRLQNLRNVDSQGNHFNNTTAKGYSWDKIRKKYKAYITLDNKFIFLGRYDTKEEARESYLKAKEVYHIIKKP